jgi:hypothetical protein
MSLSENRFPLFRDMRDALRKSSSENRFPLFRDMRDALRKSSSENRFPLFRDMRSQVTPSLHRSHDGSARGGTGSPDSTIP